MMGDLLPRQSAPQFTPIYDEGGITLYMGDCLEIIPALLAAKTFGAVVTDPPYGIGWRRGVNNARASKSHTGIVNDQDTTVRDAMLDLVADVPAVAFGSFYAPHPPRVKQVLAWRKPPDAGVVGSTTGYRRDVEPVFLVGPWPIRNVEWSSLLVSEGSIAHVASETGHPHTKPVALMRDLLARCPEGTILDPFCGSGSTLVAAKQLGRAAVGIEIDADHCNRVLRRLAQGQLFAEAA